VETLEEPEDQGEEQAQEQAHKQAPAPKPEVIVIDSDDDDKNDASNVILINDDCASSKQSSSTSLKRQYYRMFASCGGRAVIIYVCAIPDPEKQHGQNRSKHLYPSKKIVRKEMYKDPDSDEEWYACAFGGRCVGEPFGVIPTTITTTKDHDDDDQKLPPQQQEKPSEHDRYFKRTKLNHDDTAEAAVMLPASLSLSSTNHTNKKKDCGITESQNHNQDQQENDYDDSDDDSDEVIVIDSTDDDDNDCELDKEKAFLKLLLDPNYEPTGPQLLCVGGKRFGIKVIDTVQQRLLMILTGHGDEISMLKFSPVDHWILLSASNDRSCRLWNVRNGSCVAIFAGHEGHRDITKSCGWHPLGNKVVSGGHDNVVKVWDLGETTVVGQTLKASYSVRLRLNERNGLFEPRDRSKAVFQNFPIFSTNKVHIHAVDCVQFVGDLIMSKASNKIVLWNPDYSRANPKVMHPPPSNVFVLKTFSLTKADERVGFYGFCTDRSGRLLVGGTPGGEVLLWNSDSEKKKQLHQVLDLRINTCVRMTSISPDDHILLCCCDDGGIWKWDLFRR